MSGQGDKLAVIQAEETIKELDLISNKTDDLVKSFNGLLTVTDEINKGFLSGKPKEYAQAMRESAAAAKELQKIEA